MSRDQPPGDSSAAGGKRRRSPKSRDDASDNGADDAMSSHGSTASHDTDDSGGGGFGYVSSGDEGSGDDTNVAENKVSSSKGRKTRAQRGATGYTAAASDGDGDGDGDAAAVLRPVEDDDSTSSSSSRRSSTAASGLAAHAGTGAAMPATATAATAAAKKAALATRLCDLLGLLLPRETVNEAIARLSPKGGFVAAADFNRIADIVDALFLEHGVEDIYQLRREQVLLLAARHRGSPPPPLFVYRWAKSQPASGSRPVPFGPFASARMKAWKDAGFFARAQAQCVNVNRIPIVDIDDEASWLDPQQVTSFE